MEQTDKPAENPQAPPAAASSASPYTQDERLMAAIAHAGIFLTIIVALIIWLTQKDKSKYVAFQAKQALVYQLVLTVGFTVLWVLTILLTFVLIGFLLIPILLLLALAAVVYGLYAAWETYQGRDFMYAVLGEMLVEGK